MEKRHPTAQAAFEYMAIPTTTVDLSALGAYPDYSGSTNITGTANLAFQGGNVTIEYDLYGVQPECSTPNAAAPNSCGIHIHAGYGCENTSVPGGHYFNLASDPWVNVVYASSGNASNGTVSVDNNATWDETDGRVLVVHDRSGARVTCMKIEQEGTADDTPADGDESGASSLSAAAAAMTVVGAIVMMQPLL